MEARELRIGNIVSVLSPAAEVVITINQLTAIYKGDNSYKPIPITEDWLVRFGFEKKSDGVYRNGKMAIKPRYWRFETARTITKLYHVHQLQNLYYALTGTELELKD